VHWQHGVLRIGRRAEGGGFRKVRMEDADELDPYGVAV
jgi:hypothetical protein